MPKIIYPASSPYAATPQTSWYLGLYEYRDIPPASDDKPFVITPTYQYRPDRLSYDNYKTASYWWVFAVRNRDLITDSIWDLTVGKTIIIPSLATITAVIGA